MSLSLVGCALVIGASAAPSTVGDRFRTRWQPALQTTAADAALEAENAAAPSHCKLAVVGAGYAQTAE